MIPHKLLPTCRIFRARGHDRDQRQHAEKQEKKDHSSLVPDLAPTQQRNYGKYDDRKHQNELNENGETLERKENRYLSFARKANCFPTFLFFAGI